MPLPAPNLDDRRFQQLVDDAKRMVQERCPEWTDHNVSDPGVTLIETFAFMVDQLLYRLNRVPDRNFVKFLDLIGVRLFPATAAQVPVTFWLSTPRTSAVVVPQGAVAATPRSDNEAAVNFTTSRQLDIVPCRLERVATQVEAGDVVDTTDALALAVGFACFSPEPRPGDIWLIGLSDPIPSCAVKLSMSFGPVEGVGIDPTDPPLIWEAWCGDGWKQCELDSDSTGGLNQDGAVVLHVPRAHEASVIGGELAGWLRARVLAGDEERHQPSYSATPRITAVKAATVGGTVEAINAETVQDELIGLSEGVAGQRFALQASPVAASSEPVVVEVAAGDGWEQWTEVESFAGSGPDDLHFVLDDVAGEVIFGPAVREPDGSLRLYGSVPPKGAPVRVVAYRRGGGRAGNVARRSISVLRTTVPFVSRIENRSPAVGGVDAESMEAAKVRGPIMLRTRDRAVTAEDYEQLACQAAPEVARVRCVVASDADQAGGARVLVVPSAAVGPDEQLQFEQLVPEDETLEKISAYLDERRCVGARVVVEPPRYQGITVVARLRARPHVDPSRLRERAEAALYRYFSPITGGPDGDGWPFGRPVHVGEVHAVLQHLEGCDFVEDARLFGADPLTGQRGQQTQRLEIDPLALVFSYGHQVLAEAG